MANEKSTNVAGARPEGATATRARRTLSTPARYVINTILVVAFLVIGDLMVSGGAISRYQGFVLQQVGIYIIMAVSLNIATGYLGQLPLGHAGFMSIGGYSCAIFIIRVSAAIGVLNKRSRVYWVGSHSSGYTPVFAIGAGAEQFSHKTDNAQLARDIMRVAGYK